MWSDLGYHVSFGILEVPNLIKSQTYLKYGWVWGCMSQTWTYPKATMLIWNMVRFSKYGIQTWLCPKSALGYPRLDLGYDHIWNIDLSQIWSSIWDVQNQNSSLGYPKADLGHQFSLGYNNSIEHFSGFVHSCIKGIYYIIFIISVTQNCSVVPENHLIDDHLIK